VSPHHGVSNFGSGHQSLLLLWLFWHSWYHEIDVSWAGVCILDHWGSPDLAHMHFLRNIINSLCMIIVRVVRRIDSFLLFLAKLGHALALADERLRIDVHVILVLQGSSVQLDVIWIVIPRVKSVAMGSGANAQE